MEGLLGRGRELAMFFIAKALLSRASRGFNNHKDVYHPYGRVPRPRARVSDVFHRYGSAFSRLAWVSTNIRMFIILMAGFLDHERELAMFFIAMALLSRDQLGFLAPCVGCPSLAAPRSFDS
ncbi:hypothetical protein [Paenibacillus sp. Root444D2]|uniref:hypothetical protein n=1 Tax=Paenibacillus sp. Root444D2 TaxID=1736538 RepID=UPI00070E2133|nr:hypothetical protein [Paenibacillus sp. Root444D2]KQX60796.1 hypothetical protein ASD40_31385 [Paenibacillus sp. Root444D2]